jgi:hypothetical protein
MPCPVVGKALIKDSTGVEAGVIASDKKIILRAILRNRQGRSVDYKELNIY